MFFANDKREDVKAESPGITFGRSSGRIWLTTGQVGKALGERWKALNDEQKKPYVQKAEIDKQRYENEKASYKPGADVEEEDEE